MKTWDEWEKWEVELLRLARIAGWEQDVLNTMGGMLIWRRDYFERRYSPIDALKDYMGIFKNCPICGKQPAVYNFTFRGRRVACENPKCLIYGQEFWPERWQAPRPGEDQQRAKRSRLAKGVVRLAEFRTACPPVLLRNGFMCKGKISCLRCRIKYALGTAPAENEGGG